MTEERRKLARELLATATPGPWYVNQDENAQDKMVVWGISTKPDPRNADDGGIKIVETDCGHYPPRSPDAALIAAAPELLREALDEIDRLNARDLARERIRPPVISWRCRFDPVCSSMIEMFQRHGTLQEFTDAVRTALGEISLAEAEQAIAGYKKALERGHCGPPYG